MSKAGRHTIALTLLSTLMSLLLEVTEAAARKRPFVLEEATIADIQAAITAQEVTATELVELYLERIKAYNGTCVNEPEGILGPISTIPHAGS